MGANKKGRKSEVARSFAIRQFKRVKQNEIKKHSYVFWKNYEANNMQKKEGRARKVEGRMEEAKGRKGGEME